MVKTSFSRRVFMGASLTLGLGMFLYVRDDKKAGVRLYSNKVQVLLHSAYHLFPHSSLGPGAKALNIASYLSFVLQDERILKEEKEGLLHGAGRLEESSVETYKKSFLTLSSAQKETLLQSVALQRWGENFIYTTLGYIFEALLSAPVYGSNIDEAGWRWLEHDPGFPQPASKADISYEV